MNYRLNLARQYLGATGEVESLLVRKAILSVLEAPTLPIAKLPPQEKRWTRPLKTIAHVLAYGRMDEPSMPAPDQLDYKVLTLICADSEVFKNTHTSEEELVAQRVEARKMGQQRPLFSPHLLLESVLLFAKETVERPQTTIQPSSASTNQTPETTGDVTK